MKTSISSEALSHLVVEKITFPPKPDGQTDIIIRTDISMYRVALLLKKHNFFLKLVLIKKSLCTCFFLFLKYFQWCLCFYKS